VKVKRYNRNTALEILLYAIIYAIIKGHLVIFRSIWSPLPPKNCNNFELDLKVIFLMMWQVNYD